MTANLFVTANVKQLRTGGSFRILLPFFQTSWGIGVLNSAIFNSFHNRVEFCMILEGLRNFGEGRVVPLKPPSVAPVSRHKRREVTVTSGVCLFGSPPRLYTHGRSVDLSSLCVQSQGDTVKLGVTHI